MKNFLAIIGVLSILIVSCISIYTFGITSYGFGYASAHIKEATINKEAKEVNLNLRIVTPKIKQKIILSSELYDCVYFDEFKAWDRQFEDRKGRKKICRLSADKPLDFEIKGNYQTLTDGSVEIDLGNYGKRIFSKGEKIMFGVYLVPFKRSVLDSDEFSVSKPIELVEL